MREGDVGDRYLVIEGGAVDVSAPESAADLRTRRGLGEIALLRDVPRKATVVAPRPAGC